MSISVIICTYQRPDQVRTALECFAAQTYRDFELLLVDGGCERECEASRRLAAGYGGLNIRVIPSAKGLPRQRNVGLRAAAGEIICFLDDDVAVESDFLENVAALFDRPDMQDAGGVSAYDTLHYPQRINLRWRLRRLLGTVPSLEPGDIDRFGHSVPVSFSRPFTGCRPVSFFYGFCMIYRASAIVGMSFDEDLPTYGGEDRDFSFRVSRHARLLLCGDLHVRHFQAVPGRDSVLQRTFQTGFGAGRLFAKQQTRLLDYTVFLRSFLCEFLIDLLAFAGHPSWQRFQQPFARAAGMITGVRSYRLSVGTAEFDAAP